MKRIARSLAALSCVLSLAACAHHGSSTAASSAAAAGVASTEQAKGYRIKSGDFNDDDYSKIKNKFGAINKNFDPKLGSKQASGFSQQDSYFAKNFDTKKFQTKNFDGDKKFETKEYAGNTDASRFMKDSKLGEKSANETGKTASDADRNYKTKDYAGADKKSNEGAKDDYATKSDPEVDKRRKVGNAFSDPVVQDWKEQRKMTVEETKSILGH